MQTVVKNPIVQFSEWLDEAKQNNKIAEPTAMSVATATVDGVPSVRILLLKELDEKGFVFYTNMESCKSRELIENPMVSLCFYWMPLERQVRVEGRVERVSEEQADVYFATRARDSQIGAWSSQQSRILPKRVDLLQAIADNMARFEGGDVPRPPHWSGWRVIPYRIEFWQQGDFRVHEREVFTKAVDGTGWEATNLYP
jgi:pyridoxamine 5'-phosphate oxidase